MAAETAAAVQTANAGTEQATEEHATPVKQAPVIVDVLGQLAGNAADIRAAEIALQELLAKQHSLRLLMRKLEQQRVIEAVLQPLGFHQGRPVAALLLLR
jgi:sirohydrochlorin ferrochelatase